MTVRMVRDVAPFTADVHPDEVENFAAGGWAVDDSEPVAESKPAEPAPAKRPAAKRPRKAAK